MAAFPVNLLLATLLLSLCASKGFGKINSPVHLTLNHLLPRSQCKRVACQKCYLFSPEKVSFGSLEQNTISHWNRDHSRRWRVFCSPRYRQTGRLEKLLAIKVILAMGKNKKIRAYADADAYITNINCQTSVCAEKDPFRGPINTGAITVDLGRMRKLDLQKWNKTLNRATKRVLENLEQHFISDQEIINSQIIHQNMEISVLKMQEIAVHYWGHNEISYQVHQHLYWYNITRSIFQVVEFLLLFGVVTGSLLEYSRYRISSKFFPFRASKLCRSIEFALLLIQIIHDLIVSSIPLQPSVSCAQQKMRGRAEPLLFGLIRIFKDGNESIFYTEFGCYDYNGNDYQVIAFFLLKKIGCNFKRLVSIIMGKLVIEVYILRLKILEPK